MVFMGTENQIWDTGVRLTAVVGHFGSGKTEFSINLALSLAGRGKPVTLADLDIVDPYFRSREQAELLRAHGVRLIASSQACMEADVPSLPPEVQSLFEEDSGYGVLDVGGDPSGARVLARYRKCLAASGVKLLCVVNGNRPLSDTPEKALAYVEEIQRASGLPVSGLVNNTHLCALTDIEDVQNGAELVRSVSLKSGIPLVCHAVPDFLASRLPAMGEPIFPLALYMKKPWE